MSRTGRYVLLLALLTIAMSVLLYQTRDPPPLLAVVGIVNANAGECGAADGDSVVVCRLEHRVGSHPSTYQQVVVRSVEEAPPRLAWRTWTAPDSAAWARSRDSVHRALARFGGRPVSCRPLRSHPVLLHDERRKFRDHMVHFVASRLPTVYNGVTRIQWQLSAIAASDGSLDCTPQAKTRYRLISPVEWLRRQLDPY